MEWGGKLVGGALGLLVAGPVGAALGALAGHLVDDRLAGPTPRKPDSSSTAKPKPPSSSASSARHDRTSPIHHVEDTDPFAAGSEATSDTDEGPSVDDPKAVSSQFFQTTFEVMGKVAKCDGRVSESDIRAARAVMKDFALDDLQVAHAISHFNAGKLGEYDEERTVMALRRVCAGRPDLLRTFLEIQIRASIGGSDLQGPARPMLNRIAAMLGVGGLEFAQIETVLRIRHRARGNRGEAADWNRPAEGAAQAEPAARQPGSGGRERARSERSEQAGSRTRRPPAMAGMTLQEAYQVLGVLPGAAMTEITRAYRRQLSRHHPDKLKANGLPESMLDFAQQQTQLIIEAFNLIRESQGDKQ
ncbi:MAG: co-chaperone DjlA [Gammaproteobacteria bacterium]|jgi:DnaJ like chaperone protein|nr:co-chaperone DjlA [Gammaproteobacteria bacterium]